MERPGGAQGEGKQAQGGTRAEEGGEKRGDGLL